MKIEKGNEIIQLVEGDEAQDSLATIAIALIHLCMRHEFTKDDMLAAIGRQWDLYERQLSEHHAQKEKSN